MGINNRIKVSIVGAGLMAEAHLKALKNNNNFVVEGIISKNGHSAKKLAIKYKIKFYGKTIQDLRSNTQSNLILIVVPILETPKVLKLASKYSWKILVEKPVGYNYELVKKIYLNLKKERKDQNVFVGMNRRFYPSTLYAKKNLDKKKIRFIQIFDQEDLFSKNTIKKPKIVKKNFMYANSVHLVDYIRTFSRGKIISLKNKKINISKTKKIYKSEINFSSGDTVDFTSVWNMPGPWSICITNEEQRFEMRPLEDIWVRNFKKKDNIKVNFSKKLNELNLKPGLFLQLDEINKLFKNKKNDLCSLKDFLETMALVKKLFI